MKNILNKTDLQEIKTRILTLSPENTAQWGKMNVHQMLCHCADQFRLCSGQIPAKPFGCLFHRTILKFLVLYLIKTPKGVKTAPELAQGKNGTKPVEFEKDRNLLLEEIDLFIANPELKLHPHPAFGKMSRKEWGRLIWQHLDHHLQQFSV